MGVVPPCLVEEEVVEDLPYLVVAEEEEVRHSWVGVELHCLQPWVTTVLQIQASSSWLPTSRPCFLRANPPSQSRLRLRRAV